MNESFENLSATKERILDAAERLFAERGISGTSLRAVTKSAAVNLAAIHYHFGSKEVLCQSVLARRVGPVNRERMRLLDQIEGAADAPALEAILAAFLEPVLRLKRDLGESGAVWSTLIGRFYSEPAELIQPLVRDQFQEVARRFVTALCRALPSLPPEEVFRRFQFCVGVMIHVVSNLHRIELLPEFGTADPDDADGIERLCDFLAAGMRAPYTRETQTAKKTA